MALAKLRKAAGSLEPLLAVDGPTGVTSRTVLGVPVYVSPAVAAGTAWGVPRALAFLVIRSDTTIETSKHAFFTSDRVAVRAVMRCAFGFAHPQAVVKLHNVLP